MVQRCVCVGSVCAAAVLTGVSTAAPGDLSYELFAPPPSADTEFGSDVAIDGDLLIVGQERDDTVGNNAGRVHLFQLSTGALLRSYTAPGESAQDRFGCAVAIDGDRAIVGARLDDTQANDAGAAYLLDISDPSSPTLVAKLTPSDLGFGDFFGTSVAIGGGHVVVNSFANSDQQRGAIYVFDAQSGVQRARFTPASIEQGDLFGRSIDVEGDVVAAGAPFENYPQNPFFDYNNAGAAYLVSLADPAQPSLLARVEADDPDNGDEFGFSIALHGGLMVVGAPGENETPIAVDNGAAYVFNIASPGAPSQTAKLNALTFVTAEDFGTDVAIDGGAILVGAIGGPGVGLSLGAAYLFELPLGGAPIPLGSATALPGADFFGESVALGSGYAAAGAPVDRQQGSNAGAAYVFEAPGAACPGNVNGDGTVDLADLLAVLAAFGTAAPGSPLDLDGSGVIDLPDLLAVLAAFGSSC